MKLSKQKISNGVKLTQSEVEHVAKLARLRLNKEEVAKYSEQLSSILDYVSQLQKIATEGVVETSQVTGLENVFRKDEVTPCDEQTRAVIFKNVPELEENLIKTKSVFE